MRSQTDGRTVWARFSFREGHVGFKETVHGGLTATVMDEIMTWVCAVQAKRFAYCAELNVRYLHPVPPEQELHATAELVTNRRGRLFEAKAELQDEAGKMLATATGKYLPLKDAEAEGMAVDFVGDLSWLFKNAQRPRG